MKSVFLGDQHNTDYVYAPDVLAAFEQEAGLVSRRIFTPDSGDIPSDVDFIFSTWGMPALTEETIARVFPNLKAVFYAAGTVQGFARPFLAKGVRVFCAAAANAVPVAEYTLAQILLANNNYFTSAKLFSEYKLAESREVAEAMHGNYRPKIGLLGAGMIGKLVIGLLKHHDMDICVFDPFLSDEEAGRLGVKKASLDEIFSACNVVSNHLANNAQTVGMLTRPLFESMRPYATFINTGRGAQIVEADLCAVLKSRSDITALLDVTDPEPSPEGHPFYTLPNVFLTPHIAGSKGKEVHRMSEYMLRDFRRFQSNEPCLYEVTEDMLATMA